MKELVFALQFKGKARPVEGVEGKLVARTTAAGQILRTALNAKGLQARAESRPGPRATFESEVQMTGAGTFVESGRLGSDRRARSVFRGDGSHHVQLYGRIQGRGRGQPVRAPIPAGVMHDTRATSKRTKPCADSGSGSGQCWGRWSGRRAR